MLLNFTFFTHWKSFLMSLHNDQFDLRVSVDVTREASTMHIYFEYPMN